MKKNLQHPISNSQRPKLPRLGLMRCSLLAVGCRLFLLLIFSTLPAQGQSNALPTLSPPDGELPPTFWEQHAAFIVISGLGIIGMLVLVLWLICRPRPKILVPPAAQARRALEDLRRLPEDDVVVSRVSQVVRHYFIAAFQLPPGEFTTAEFARILSGHEQIGAELSTVAVGFLHACDNRKFSPAASGPADAVNRALQLIAYAEDRRRQPDQAAPAPAHQA